MIDNNSDTKGEYDILKNRNNKQHLIKLWEDI